MTKFRVFGAVRVGRALALVAGAGLLVSCASVETNSQATSSDAGHSRAAYAQNVDAMAVEAYAALGRGGETPPAINISQTLRVAIGQSSTPAIAAHESAFGANEGLAADAHAGAVTIHSPSKILIQNSVDNGGWREEDGKYVHAYSGLVCNETEMAATMSSGGTMDVYFVPLTDLYVFDSSGSDVGCNYQNKDLGIYLTFYASNWPDVTLQEHYAGAMKDIVDNLPVKEPTMSLVATKKRDDDGPTSIEGQTMAGAFILESSSNKAAYKTVLWLNKTGPWHVKGRATFVVEMERGEPQVSVPEMLLSSKYSEKLLEVDRYINQPQAVSYRK